mmetsp:Transcript_14810/g.40633  ORF Transcript_14810/g.40633 Transcript_14810/m.40633 type:complete len:225 (+) Transcript_14810:1003-1677(+)
MAPADAAMAKRCSTRLTSGAQPLDREFITSYGAWQAQPQQIASTTSRAAPLTAGSVEPVLGLSEQGSTTRWSTSSCMSSNSCAVASKVSLVADSLLPCEMSEESKEPSVDIDEVVRTSEPHQWKATALPPLLQRRRKWGGVGGWRSSSVVVAAQLAHVGASHRSSPGPGGSASPSRRSMSTGRRVMGPTDGSRAYLAKLDGEQACGSTSWAMAPEGDSAWISRI